MVLAFSVFLNKASFAFTKLSALEKAFVRMDRGVGERRWASKQKGIFCLLFPEWQSSRFLALPLFLIHRESM